MKPKKYTGKNGYVFLTKTFWEGLDCGEWLKDLGSPSGMGKKWIPLKAGQKFVLLSKNTSSIPMNF